MTDTTISFPSDKVAPPYEFPTGDTSLRTIVIGGGSGIGLACATALASAGARVFLSGRRATPLEIACMQLPNSNWATGDATKEDQVLKVIESAVSHLAGLDAVVVAAGRSAITHIATTPLTDFTSIMDLNLLPVFLYATHTADLLASSDNASFTVISSMYGLVRQRERVAYCAAKSATIGLIRAMALDLADVGVRANAVCPGFVETELSLDLISKEPNPEAALKMRRSMSPLARGGKVEEIGAMVAFLSSRNAAWITGQAIAVDGGYTAR